MDIAVDKPRMRGVLHAWSAPIAATLGAVLLFLAADMRARIGTGVWAVTLTGLFAVSATYHRGQWRPAVKTWLQRVDHSMIFLFIAGSYTPVALVVLEGHTSWTLLTVVWAGALAGVVTRLTWNAAPRWMFVPLYIGLGWTALTVLPELAANAPLAANLLIAIGGVLYTVGAVVFATRWPDPVPDVFGFHEVFHMLTVVAASCHAVAIAMLVL